jgi:alkylhydroperoxidase/carboxymuconolactone decarboxylase family protein YurZ
MSYKHWAHRFHGVSKDEIREVFMQVACYAGIPAGLDGFRIAREVFAEMDEGEIDRHCEERSDEAI